MYTMMLCQSPGVSMCDQQGFVINCWSFLFLIKISFHLLFQLSLRRLRIHIVAISNILILIGIQSSTSSLMMHACRRHGICRAPLSDACRRNSVFQWNAPLIPKAVLMCIRIVSIDDRSLAIYIDTRFTIPN